LNPKDLRNFGNPLRLPGEEGLMGALDASNTPLRFSARAETVEIQPGRRTEMWVYKVEAGSRSYTKPTFRVRRGSRFSAELLNGLDADTTIHWHGLGVPAEMDGHPTRHVYPGRAFHYGFFVDEAASTYWYHPHAHRGTALQTYRGLAGLFLVEDGGDDRLRGALDLRFGETEVPLVIQDRTFDDDMRLVYDPDEATRFMGVTGDTVLVNLTPTPSWRSRAGPTVSGSSTPRTPAPTGWPSPTSVGTSCPSGSSAPTAVRWSYPRALRSFSSPRRAGRRAAGPRSPRGRRRGGAQEPALRPDAQRARDGRGRG
jgi:hypothetical protein